MKKVVTINKTLKIKELRAGWPTEIFTSGFLVENIEFSQNVSFQNTLRHMHMENSSVNLHLDKSFSSHHKKSREEKGQWENKKTILRFSRNLSRK